MQRSIRKLVQHTPLNSLNISSPSTAKGPSCIKLDGGVLWIWAVELVSTEAVRPLNFSLFPTDQGLFRSSDDAFAAFL